MHGCNDDFSSSDHRDPSHPIRNILKTMHQMRENYPVLRDGISLHSLSKLTRNIYLPGSGTAPTELGIWSVLRSQLDTVQDLSSSGHGDQSIWLVYHNDNSTTNYLFNCSDSQTALIAPFNSGTRVKNLFYPYDEATLISSTIKLGINGSTSFNGCLDELSLPAWGFKAYVPKDKFVGNGPMITKFLPSHDARILSSASANEPESIEIQIHFSAPMDCDSIGASIEIASTTEFNVIAELNTSSILCKDVPVTNITSYNGGIPTSWVLTANLINVHNGVHAVTVRNASTADGKFHTGVRRNSVLSIYVVGSILICLGRRQIPVPHRTGGQPDYLSRSELHNKFASPIRRWHSICL